jgi:integrase
MLSEEKIRKLKPDRKRREIADGRVRGLYFIIQPSGATSWALRYRHNGIPRKFTLTGVSGIKDARKQAEEVRGEIARGDDPAAMKAIRRAPLPAVAAPESFAAAVEVFLARYVATRQNTRSAYETERLLRTKVLPLWGEKNLREIRKADVHALMDRIIDANAKVSANHVLSKLKTCWKFWIGRDMCELNPVAGIEKPIKQLARERVLADEEMLAILNAVDGCGWPYGPAVALLAATGCRRDEIAGLRWSELDFENGLIAIPSSRRKAGIAHTIPLSSMARAIIADLPRWGESEWVFPARPRAGGRGGQHFSGFSKNKLRLDQLSGVRDWTLHDLRRTMATRMQALGIRPEVIEACLGHERQGIIAVYQRHRFIPEMTAAFEAWARYLDGLRHPEQAPANVISLR